MNNDSMMKTLAARGFNPVRESFRTLSGIWYGIFRATYERLLIIWDGTDDSFSGISQTNGNESWQECPLTHENCNALRARFPYTAPTSLHDKDISIGLGDRLGLVAGAHIKALEGTGAFPVIAQQSKRELSLTGRSYSKMLDDVAWQVFEAGYEGGYGADGDHLKTLEEVSSAICDGATMITLDCSEHINSTAYTMSTEDARALCEEQFSRQQLDTWYQRYFGKSFSLKNGDVVSFEAASFPQLLLTYGRALAFIKDVYENAILKASHKVSFEVSIDETEVPTTPEAHFFIAHQLQAQNVVADSMAPRFCGEFQKGIDYIGNLEQFEEEFKIHVAIADMFGYRISVHSGSDKFSVFPYVGKISGYRFHLKTSGTSWVEAVRVIAMCNPPLFRRMAAYSCRHFEEARKYYHVTASADRFPDLSKVDDRDLPALLSEIDARQVMHITYGFLLQAKDEDGKDLFYRDIYHTLQENKATLDDVISKHIRRHTHELGIVK